MTRITKNMIVVSALMAAGLVTAVGTIVPRACSADHRHRSIAADALGGADRALSRRSPS